MQHPTSGMFKMKKYLFAALIILGAALLFYRYEAERITETIYAKRAETIKERTKRAIAQKKKDTSSIAYIFSQDMQLKRALARHDAKGLDYSDIIEGLEDISGYRYIWVQLIDAHGHSLYRSWSESSGDDLLAVREDLKQAFKLKKRIDTMSVGRYTVSLKNIIPIYEGNRFLGIFEMITHFDSIAEELVAEGIRPLLVLEKHYKRQLDNPFSNLFIGEYYIANTNAPHNLMEMLTQKDIETLFAVQGHTVFRNCLVVHYPLQNESGKILGHFLLFVPLSQIDMTPLFTFKVNFLIAVLLLGALLAALAALKIYRGYARRLNHEVEKKTAIIQTKSDELEALLATYDANVIFSETDLKGVITKVSQAFCDVSGYSREELLGKPHSIVRHPDMPKSLFKKMWRKLARDKWVKAEIKNRKKDGGYYWVSADIGPYYDLEGKKVGYRAIRQDITAIKDMEEMQKEVILVLSAVGESHSHEVAQHVKRVAAYCRLLAQYYGLSGEEISLIEQASPMHDIGKVAIEDEILKKPEKLTKEEFETIKTHAEEGYKILSVSSRPLMKMAATIALEHHEKWDGSGYPKGLKGEEISIYGRITALADVFDALSHKRCYKEAWEDEEVFAYIRSHSGTQFDPKLVELFFEHIDAFLAVRDRYRSES